MPRLAIVALLLLGSLAHAEPVPGYRHGGAREKGVYVMQGRTLTRVSPKQWFAAQALTWQDRVQPSASYDVTRLPTPRAAALAARSEARADRKYRRTVGHATGADALARVVDAQLGSPFAARYAATLRARSVPDVLRDLSPEERRFLYGDAVRRSLTAPVYVAEVSPTVGRGLFARAPIAAGEPIGEYTGRLENGEEGRETNGYLFNLAHLGVVDGDRQGNLMRFINHSQHDANAMPIEVTVHGVPHVVLVATKAIDAHTQIAFDYGSHYWKNRTRPVAIDAKP